MKFDLPRESPTILPVFLDASSKISNSPGHSLKLLLWGFGPNFGHELLSELSSHNMLDQWLSPFSISWHTHEILKFCGTPKNRLHFLLIWQNRYNFDSFTPDNYCCVGCFHYFIWKSKEKEVITKPRSLCPPTSKASLKEAGADVKESGFFQVPATRKMGDSCLKSHCSASGILQPWEEGSPEISGDVQFLSSALGWFQCYFLHASPL